LGHTNLGVTSIYLQGIDNAEIIATVHGRSAPMIPASTARSRVLVRSVRATVSVLTSRARAAGANG
jgi:hypothetical protein